MKSIYKILITIGVIVLVAIGIYLGWKKITALPESPVAEDDRGLRSTTSSEPLVPPSGTQVKRGVQQKLTKLSDQRVFDYWLNTDTEEAWYFASDGKVLQAKAAEDIETSNQIIKALNFIEVAEGSQKVLAAFGDPHAPQWGIFDVIDRVWRPLPQDIQTAAWGSSADKLIAVRKNVNELNLVEIDILKNPPAYKTFIRDFRFKDINLMWRPPKSIVISEKPAATYAGRIWELDPEKNSIYLLHGADFGLVTKWLREVPYILKFAAPDLFSITNQNFQELMPLFFTTLPNKCHGTKEVLYCFAPQELSPNITLPDDYLERKFYSIDDLIAVNLQSGAMETLIRSNEGAIPALDAENPHYLNGRLYFVNRYDEHLYVLNVE